MRAEFSVDGDVIEFIEALPQPAMTGQPVAPQQVDRNELEMKIQAMYRNVAEHPRGDFHFEMSRVMAERLGYRLADLDRIPAESIDSFAGVGYYFHFIDDIEGARVLDLGSGSGMDSFIASRITGATGTVIGLDMTDAQSVSLRADKP